MQEVEKGKGPPMSTAEAWQRYIKDQTQWLFHYYKKNDVKNPSQKINKVKDLFDQLKEKIEKSKYNQGNRYFNDFAKQQQAKFYRKTARVSDFEDQIAKQNENHQKQQKQSSIVPSALKIQNKKSNYKFSEFLYKNQKSMIIQLTKQRFAFLNVARHIYREQNQEQKQFYFDVQRGIAYGEMKNKRWQITSSLFFYIFIRDIILAVVQLQKHDIIHLDIAKHNILLFNCPFDKINNMEYLRKEANRIRFKIIDFGHAFFIKGDEPQKIELLKIIIKEKSIQQFHSQALREVLNFIDSHSPFKVQDKQQWDQMIKDRKYNQIIAKAKQLIKQQTENK